MPAAEPVRSTHARFNTYPVETAFAQETKRDQQTSRPSFLLLRYLQIAAGMVWYGWSGHSPKWFVRQCERVAASERSQGSPLPARETHDCHPSDGGPQELTRAGAAAGKRAG